MSDELDNLPPKLKADLSRAVDRPVEIPAALDASILLAGRRHAGRRRWFRRGFEAAAVAAVLVITVWGGNLLMTPSSKPVAMDVDHNGRVDILDAYAMARKLPSGQDVNGDGKVDQADVDAIAKAAVDLEGGTRP